MLDTIGSDFSDDSVGEDEDSDEGEEEIEFKYDMSMGGPLTQPPLQRRSQAHHVHFAANHHSQQLHRPQPQLKKLARNKSSSRGRANNSVMVAAAAVALQQSRAGDQRASSGQGNGDAMASAVQGFKALLGGGGAGVETSGAVVDKRSWRHRRSAA